MYFTTYLLLVQVAGAFQLPFHIPWVSAASGDEQKRFSVTSEVPSNRIAVIGAGAGGSASAHWIGKAKERYGLDVEIDIFDSNTYIGGRSTTVQPYDNPDLRPLELGASIFVEANKNLWRATEEFHLIRSDSDEGDDTTGIWDGEKFLLTLGSGSSWWDTAKIVWRYGVQAPKRTQAIVDGMVKQFVTLYTDEFGKNPWANITSLASKLGWSDVVEHTTAEFFESQGINKRWTMEMVEGATRVNYGQNVDEIHALEGMCSLATDGASSIRGGNKQIFEEFVKRSNASVHLATKVTSISQTPSGQYTVRTQTTDAANETERSYRAVILAAPFHSSSIDISLQSATVQIPPQPYVHLHVTLLSTTSPHARPRYFNLKDNDTVPSMVLTTSEGARERNGENAPEFNSVSYHGKITKRDGSPANTSTDGREEWAVKIFSKQKIEDKFLRKLFGQVGWVYRKEWDAYPHLPPTAKFPPIKLANGLYYVNAFEPFISTMETETISARNVVELLMQEEFNASICKRDDASTTPEDSEDFVYGWDC